MRNYGGRTEDVARGGLEPPPTAPKAAVLPLDDRAITVTIQLCTGKMQR